MFCIKQVFPGTKIRVTRGIDENKMVQFVYVYPKVPGRCVKCEEASHSNRLDDDNENLDLA